MAKKVSHEEFRFDYVINGDDAQKELYDLGQKTNKLTQENKELGREKAKLIAAGKKETAEYKKLDAAMRENSKNIRANNTRMDELRHTIGVTNLSFKELRRESKKLSNELNGRSDFGSAKYKKLEARLQAVNARMSELRGKARSSESSLSRWADGFNKYSALGLGFIAMLTGVVFQLQQIIDFNGKMSESQSDVMKTTGMTKNEVDDLTKSFGLLQSRTSRINLLNIAEQGGRIGVAKEDIGDFVEVMNKAVVALGDEFPGGAQETANSLGKLKGLFEETRDQGIDEAYNGIGSAINELGASGLASAPNLANFTKRVGAMPDALRPSITDALGLGAALEQSGLEAEQSARAYSIFMTTASKDVGKFATVMGIGVDEVKTMINTDPTSFFLQFSEGLKGMDATDTAQTLGYLGLGADGVKKILGAAASNTQLFRDKILLANDAMEKGTSLVEEYNIKNSNFQGTLDKIGKTIRGAFISDVVVNFLTKSVDLFAQFIGATEESSSSVFYFRKTLVFLIKVFAIATTAVLSYKAAAKLATLWSGRLSIQTKFLAIAQKAAAFSTGLLKGAVYLLQIGYYRLTGQMAKARGAMVAFTMATNLNPLMAALAVIAAIGVAYVVFSESAEEAKTQQDFLNDAMDEAKVKTAAQSAKVKALDKVVRDETKSQEERKAAIEKLNKIVPNYNRDLDLGKTALENSKVALDQYVDSLKRQAQVQALNNLMNAKAKELEEAKQVNVAESLNWMERQLQRFGGPTASVFATANNEQNNNIDKLEREFDVIAKLYAEIDAKQASQLTPLERELINLRSARDDFKKGTAEYIEYQKQIDALTKKFNVPTGDDPEDNAGKTKEFDYINKLRDMRYAAAEERINLITDTLERERALEDIAHAKKMEELDNQKIKENAFLGISKEQAAAFNKQVDERMELQEKTHQARMGAIAANGMREDLENKKEFHESELQELKIKQQGELTVFKGTDQQRKDLIEKHNHEEIELQESHAIELGNMLERLLSDISFEGIDLDLLSEEDSQALQGRLDQLRAKLAELGLAKSSLTGSGNQANQGIEDAQVSLGKVDIFGFTPQDWQDAFENSDTALGKIELIGMGLQALGDIWGSVSAVLDARENASMQEFTAAQERKKESLDNRLDRGFINQRQYNKAVEALEEEQAKKEAELSYKQAKRQRITALADIASSTAMAIMRTNAAYALIPGGAAIAAGINIATVAQAALQTGLVLATPLPAKGFQDGLYPMMREQDNKIFDVQFGGSGSTQFVSSPTHFKTGNGSDFIAGENSSITRPELIIDSDAYSKFDPAFKQVLTRQIRAVKGYENGMYSQDVTSPVSFNQGGNSVGSSNLESLIQTNNMFLKYLIDNGVTAVMDKNMRNMQYLQEELDRFNKFNDNKRV